MQPWYRQFWPWFIISLPLASVIAGVSTFIIAHRQTLDLVAEDYYQKGKAINQDLGKQEAAQAAGIRASLHIQADGDWLLTLSGRDLRPNEALRLTLFHATLAIRDRRFLLTADAKGRYRLQPDAPLSGKWHLRLEPLDERWRLQQSIRLPLSKPLRLQPFEE